MARTDYIDGKYMPWKGAPMSNPDSTEREAAWQDYLDQMEPRCPHDDCHYDGFDAGWDARDAAVRELVEAAQDVVDGGSCAWCGGDSDKPYTPEEGEAADTICPIHELSRALAPFVSPSEEVAR